MSAHFTSNKLRIRDTSNKVNIPNNPKAKLMYYLNCISCVLRTDKLGKFTNYEEYYNITDSEIDDILYLARIFNPKIMVQTGIFVLNEDLDILNRFFEITNEELGIHANDEIFIGGISVRVIKLMLFKKEWVVDNYLEPFEILSRRNEPVQVQSFVNVYSTRRYEHIPESADCRCDCNIY